MSLHGRCDQPAVDWTWQSGGRVEAQGYTVEVRLPLQSIRFKGGDDVRMGAKSTAILFGELDLVAQGVLYAVMFAALALVGRQAGLGRYFWYGVGAAVLLVAYEFVIARHRDREACFRAFLHNHWVGAVVFAGIALDFALR